MITSEISTSAKVPKGAILLSSAVVGQIMADTEEENADFGIEPIPGDFGMGTCIKCGGNPKASSLKKRMGTSMWQFFNARIRVLLQMLSEAARIKFNALSFQKKCKLIEKLITEGKMI